MIPPPDAAFQVSFLQQVQRILAEGSFVATYKFALLHALADLAVLKGEDGGGKLVLSTRDIAERFIELYWRQAVPFPGSGGNASLLRQNAGDRAAVLNRVLEARSAHAGSLARAKASEEWTEVVARVASTVKDQPLWKLQTVGGGPLDFLYPKTRTRMQITLSPGVGYCLRAFHGLVTQLARAGWVRYVRRHKDNFALLGERADLHEFMFGAERSDLSAHREILTELQGRTCFYCRKAIPKGSAGEVDHFVPWSRYPVDLGHNFVLAHASCNNAKSDRLAAVPHLESWAKRNEKHGLVLAAEFDGRGILYDLSASTRIVSWAYGALDGIGGRVWMAGAKEEALVEFGGGVAEAGDSHALTVRWFRSCAGRLLVCVTACR